MSLKIASANFYVGNKHPGADANMLMDRGFDIAGIQEGHGGNYAAIKRDLKSQYKIFTEDPSRIEHLDVPILYNPAKFKVLGHWTRQINKRSQKENIGMPRAATVLRFKYQGKTISFINIHANAAVQSGHTGLALPTRIKRVYEYVKGAIIIERMIRNAKKRGDEVIAVGDLNWRARLNKVWNYSPPAIFKRCDLSYYCYTVDYIAWSKGLTAHIGELIKNTGSDHDWLTAVIDVK